MIEFKKVLVPTDFSEYSENAMRYAQALAKGADGTVHFVHVVDPGMIDGAGMGAVYASGADLNTTIKGIQQHAQEKLDQLVKRATLLGLKAEGHLHTGSPAKEINAAANAIDADLIVLATHGRSGLDKLVFGSTYNKVIRLAEHPVLAIKHPEHEFVIRGDADVKLAKVLCPVDFSEFSRLAVPMAVELCKQYGAKLSLIHAVDTWLDYPEFSPGVAVNNSPQLMEAAKESLDKLAGELALDVDVHVETGIPARVIADYTKKNDIDLVVMTTHGRSGISHALLGSVTEKVTLLSNCPVMTVRPAPVES